MDPGNINFGIQIRTQGPQSTQKTILDCTKIAEEMGFEELYVVDHIAIPPDDVEGSDGRYLDPLSVLNYLAAQTQEIALCTGVLVLPYRPILPTAKVVATLQELSGNRLKLGLGVGWMNPEFKALGIDRSKRGRLFNEGLEFLNRAFSSDCIAENGQEFMFLPRPSRPPLLIGGTPEYAFDRAVKYGEGWIPMAGRNLEKFRAPISELRERFLEADKGEPEIAIFARLAYEESAKISDQVGQMIDIGVTSVIHGGVRYRDSSEFFDIANAIKLARSKYDFA